MALVIADRWLIRNEPIYNKFSIAKQIIRWEHLLQHPQFEQQKEAERVYRENLELKLRLELHQEFQRELAKLEKKYAKAAARAQSSAPQLPKPKKTGHKRLPPKAE